MKRFGIPYLAAVAALLAGCAVVELPFRAVGATVQLAGYTVSGVAYVIAFPIKLIKDTVEGPPEACSPEGERCEHDPFRSGLRVYVTYMTNPPGGKIVTAGKTYATPVELIYNFGTASNSGALTPAEPSGYSQGEKYVLAPAELIKTPHSPPRVILPPATAHWDKKTKTMTPVVDLVPCQPCQSVFPGNAVIYDMEFNPNSTSLAHKPTAKP